MALCTGCGKKYRWLSGDRCGRCQDRAAKQNLDWTPCGGCGSTFEFPDEGVDCDSCKDRDAAISHVNACMEDPPNPHNRGQYIPLAHPPVTSDPEAKLFFPQLLKSKAARVLSSLVNSHAEAVQNATHPDNVARSKVRGAAAVARAIPRIQVKLSRATNANTRPSEKNSNLMPTLQDWPETTPFYQVRAALGAVLDHHYTTKYAVRVSGADFSLKYVASKTGVNDGHTQGTLGDLWASSTGITVKAGDRKNRVLDLEAVVDYPKTEVFASDDEDAYTGAAKRKASSYPTHASKRPALTPAGAAFYQSTVQLNEDRYIVSRIDCTFDNVGTIIWTEDSHSFEVSLRKESSASGSMKTMNTLTLDGQKFAAKCFFSVGGQPPSGEENLAYLKNELVVQKLAARSLTRFQERVATGKISIADLQVADSFILRVAEGPQKGHAWIVDRLLLSTDVTKFSGTEVAGSHGDLFGATCDSLAHYSLEDSEGSLVFVDIQGIKQSQYIHGIRGSDQVVLFDLMAHTIAGGVYLGDKGVTGIEEFKRQHICNTICKAMPLKNLASSTRSPSTPKPQSHSSQPPPPPVHKPQHPAKPPADAIQMYRVRAGSGIVDSEITNPRTPRGLVSYTGGFNNLLEIDTTKPQTCGPYTVCAAKLTNTRNQSSDSIYIYKLSNMKPSDEDEDPVSQEICRYSDARDLLERFEDLLQNEGIAVAGPHTPTDEDLAYFLDLVEFEILQTKPDSYHTWLYFNTSLPRALTETDIDNDPDHLRDSRDRKFFAIMEAFSHFVYEQSGGGYVYHHFRFAISFWDADAWAELKDGPNPCIIYFKTSSAIGGSCHNDGGRLGIADFKIRHEETVQKNDGHGILSLCVDVREVKRLEKNRSVSTDSAGQLKEEDNGGRLAGSGAGEVDGIIICSLKSSWRVTTTVDDMGGWGAQRSADASSQGMYVIEGRL
ncbi:hypothetical protein C8R47DRAFT_1077727 [Mycena vitilis]|nr:hypothetical protein C8R47DRAFT_1077727 [Mycena vitilis]